LSQLRVIAGGHGEILKEQTSINRVQIVGLVIAALSLIPLLFDVAYI